MPRDSWTKDPRSYDAIEEHRRDREVREQIERATQKAHKAAEPSDPPASERDTAPGFTKPGIRSGIAHLSAGIAASSKRVAFLLACWGTISTTAGSAFIWWGAHQGYVTQDQAARDRAALDKIDRAVERIEDNVGTWRDRIVKLEESDKKHGEALASLRPVITATSKSREK